MSENIKLDIAREAQGESISFNELSKLISRLVKPEVVEEDDDKEYPGWDGVVKSVALDIDLAQKSSLGSKVDCRIIGSYVDGVSIVMRSKNLFNTQRYGFYIQPEQDTESGERGFDMWQGPAFKPEHGKVYWGSELIDRERAEPADALVVESLIQSLKAKASTRR